MKQRRAIPSCFLALLASPHLLAEAPKSAGLLNDALKPDYPALGDWDIGGQLRFRYEVKDGAGPYPNNDFVGHGVVNENDWFLFREKLHVGWQPENWVKLYVEGRGSQVASDDRDPSPDQDIWDLQQAYVEFGSAKLFPLSAKLGRQELSYGDQRFIGIGDWSNTGRSFDAAKFRYSISEKSWVDLFTGRVVIPVDDTFNKSNDYDQFSGLYASSQELLKGVETQAFFLARNVGENSPNAVSTGFGGPSERDVYTYGVRVKSLPDAFQGWDFAFEGAGQFGEVVTTGVSRDLQAFVLTGSGGYTFDKVEMKPRIGIGWDYASGDSDPNDGDQGTFESLFGTNHSFYGVADLIGLRNINSPRVSFSAKPVKGLTVSADYLLFWLANTGDSFYPESGSGRTGNGYGKNPKFGSYVGSEIDLVAKYAINSWSEAQIGYAHFFAGDYIEDSVGSVPANGGARDADWAYAQITVNF
ncbi:MAG: alginate export family protein [Luteolibacter sp.]